MRFIMIDEIVDIVPGKHVVAVKMFPANAKLFEDHFPGFPVVPGVLLLEVMAQAAGKPLDLEDRSRGKAMLVRVTRGSFRKWVRPGQRIDIRADIQSSTQVSASAHGRLMIGGDEVASADMLFSFLHYDELSEGYRDEVLENYLKRRQSSARP